MISINKYINKHQFIHKAQLVLLFASLSSLSLNVFLVFKPEWSYLDSRFIDYWAPKMYLSQVLIATLWLFTGISRLANRGKPLQRPQFRFSQIHWKQWILLIGVGMLILRQIWSAHPWPAFIWLATLVLGPVLLGVYLWRKKPSPRLVILGLLSGISLQAILGLLQFVFQINIAPYWLFGEPVFLYKNLLTTSNFWLESRVLPYGGTPHPNILAGWMVLGIYVLHFSKKYVSQIARISGFILFFSVLLLTESVSAWIAAALCIGFPWIFKQSPKKIALFAVLMGIFLSLLPFLSSTHLYTRNFVDVSSLERRQILTTIGLQELCSHPWGTGWNQHIAVYTPRERALLQPGFLQPIHNVWVIFALENGFWTIFLLFAFSIIVQFNYPKIFMTILLLSPIFSLDHYLYTQLSGFFIILFVTYFLFLNDSR